MRVCVLIAIKMSQNERQKTRQMKRNMTTVMVTMEKQAEDAALENHSFGVYINSNYMEKHMHTLIHSLLRLSFSLFNFLALPYRYGRIGISFSA